MKPQDDIEEVEETVEEVEESSSSNDEAAQDDETTQDDEAFTRHYRGSGGGFLFPISIPWGGLGVSNLSVFSNKAFCGSCHKA